MATKKTSAKTPAAGKLDPDALREQLRGLLAAVPGLSKANLDDEVARAVRFLDARPELQARLGSGALTAEQLLAMVRAQATVTMGESSAEHTRRELDRYLGGDRKA